MKIALIYDFDGTLSPGNMQEYDFIPATGKDKDEFWARCRKKAAENDADPILTYLSEMIVQANMSEMSLRREAFVSYGARVELFEGVREWFGRISKYGASKGVEIEHYINSSGIKEMIEGTPIARYFKKIFACSFFYNVDGVAYWPSVAVNYTNKTQFLFKINKGISSVADDKLINQYMPENEREIPFRNMIYIGDGTTDIPCMRLVKEKMGHAIAVYNPKDQQIGYTLEKLITDNRVNFTAPADYKPNSKLDKIVKAVVDMLAAESRLMMLK
ncbi:conserved hypothetical protein [Mucinivorans hirudinis]|uniref:Phosphoserine phosphatase n=1 Tax=Mucinivorans hirudinis TaxID=1433126 RepID=A0A060R7W7_9BACT|nr:conserved hypothetical protein [Mucinivorans hirudinis]